MPNPVWTDRLYPASMEWRLMKAGAQFRSPFTGSLQAVSFVGEYWAVSVGFSGEGRVRANSGELEATLMYLAGGVNQVDIFHWARPQPRGTMRGSPVVQTVASRGNDTLMLTVASGATLLAGDLFHAGTQVFMVRTNCAAVSTTLTVPLVNRVRGTIAEASSVVWDRPLLSVVAPELSAGLVYRPGMTLPTDLMLVEP